MNTRLLVSCLALLTLPGGLGCAGSQSSTADASTQDRSRAIDRIKGRWLLVDYRPEQPLEPMLGALLGVQIGKLVATFDGQTLTAVGTGFQTQRSYSVTEAAGDSAHVVLQDDVGVRYDVECQFVADGIQFHAETSPWQGTGKLQRVQ